MSTKINNATNFENVPASVSSAKKKIGYTEKFEIELDNPLSRVLTTYIETIQFGSTGYQINNGNNVLTFGFSDTTKQYFILPGFYTGEELAEQINNRISSEPTGFEESRIFPLEFSYNDISNLFTIQGDGAGVTVLGILNRQLLKSSTVSQIGGAGEEVCSFAPLISFFGTDTLLEASTFVDSQGTLLISDVNNPGDIIANSSYQAFETITVQQETKKMGFSEGDSKVDIPVVTTAGITGFAMAAEVQAALNAASSGYEVFYNYNNYKLLIRNIEQPFGVSPGFIFEFNPDFDPPATDFGYTVLPNSISDTYEADTEIHGTTITHTLVAGVNDAFVINEGNGDITLTLLPGTYTLPELAALLQVTMNANVNLVNNYEVTFSARTAKFRIKVLKQGRVFPTWTISAATTVGAEYGYTVLPVTGQIIYSNVAQFELFPSLSGTFHFLESNSISLAIGIYTPTEAATLLENGINSSGVAGTYVVTYNNNRKFYEITSTGGFVGTIFILGAATGASTLYGFIGRREGDTSVAPQEPITSNAVTLFYGPLYLYIKSNILTEKKLSLQSFDPFYKNVMAEIILDKEAGNVIFNSKSNDRVNRLAYNTTVSTVDVRLEDENGVLYNPNGFDWAFTIVFQRF